MNHKGTEHTEVAQRRACMPTFVQSRVGVQLRLGNVPAERALSHRALVKRPLAVHDVADLEAEASKRRQLFRSQLATNPQFHLNSHPQLSSLRGCEFSDSLFDYDFVGGCRV